MKRSTVRLAASYLAIIMTMSISFSVVFYATSAHELERKPDAGYYERSSLDIDHEVDEWLRERAVSGRARLAVTLALLNVAALALGAALSYFLARRTLAPIEAAMDAQDRFIADASHELRTPLTSLLLNNEVALRRKKLSVRDSRQVIERNVGDLARLTALSDTLLDLAVKNEAVTLKKLSVEHLFNTVLRDVRPLAEKKSITLRCTITEPKVTSNEARLAKLLVIFCDNAIKYSEPHTAVTLVCARRGEAVELSVQDRGVGMSKEELTHIFDRFYRADTSRSHGDGYGLGLAIAAKLAHELGATLHVESTPREGSTFTIRVPQ